MNTKATITIAAIDTLLSQGVNLILHHHKFQNLEARWRGLVYLLKSTSSANDVKIRLLDLKWNELSNDLLNAIDFDQSQLFKKIYSEEFDQPGGNPYNLILCDYFIDPRAVDKNKDIYTLMALAGVAAAAFCQCLINISHKFLGIDRFTHLENVLDLEGIFKQQEYSVWKKLRTLADTRFISILFSTVSLRLPYKAYSLKDQGFYFEEQIYKNSDYLWGSSLYHFAQVIIRSYDNTGWFLKIRGTYDNLFNGGIVEKLPVHYYKEDISNFYVKPSLEIVLKKWQENFLTLQGFIILNPCRYSAYLAFYACPTLYQPLFKLLPDSVNDDRKISVEEVLIVSRFAHYLKIIGRQKIGLYITTEELEIFLQKWISKYTAYASGAITEEFLKKYPLKEARVSIQKDKINETHFLCTVFMIPHQYREQFDGKIVLAFKLIS